MPTMLHTPPNAGRRHFVIEGLTGWDAVFGALLPRLWTRVLAIKVLRGWHVVRPEASVLGTLLRAVCPLPAGDLTFMWRGQLLEILNTHGKTRVLERGEALPQHMPGSIH